MVDLIGQAMLVEKKSKCPDVFDFLALPIPAVDAGVANQGLEEGQRLLLQLIHQLRGRRPEQCFEGRMDGRHFGLGSGEEALHLAASKSGRKGVPATSVFENGAAVVGRERMRLACLLRVDL